jgi:enamine deaminase RidA (YjgF/YER057c/UK114 family)
MSVYEKLRSLNIEIPTPVAPVAAFIPFYRSSQWLFVSGHIAKKGDEPWVGQLGSGLATAEGREAARAVAIDLLGTLQVAVQDLNRITRIAKLMVLVNSAPTFVQQHLVANGASELFESIFGERGKHTRSAFGVAQVPFGSCVEIELIAEVA